MPNFAELEIALRRKDAGAYPVEMRFVPAGSDTEERFPTKSPASAKIDLTQLKQLRNEPAEYGAKLGAVLFEHPEIKAGFEKARTSAQSAAALRVRLFIDAGASELHQVQWETLNDADGKSLFNGEKILFSRYLSSADWNPVGLRAQSSLRALVAIANPAGLEGAFDPGVFDPDKPTKGVPNLAAVDTAGELERAKKNLAGVEIDALASPGAATLSNILAKLHDGYDILYLVCHGALMYDGEPRLWLEDKSGGIDVVDGSIFANQIRELSKQPRLIVLASCQSAGTGDPKIASDSLSALGPRLAEAGIPAVLAMQGKVPMRLVAEFMPAFFSELKRDGQIDRAMGWARSRIAADQEYWMPVLFMRLRSGCLWYSPGFGKSKDGGQYDGWPTIKMAIEQQQCTPIIGAGFMEAMAGSTRKIARQWADKYSFPLAPSDLDDLPTVAQYLATNQKNPQFPRWQLASYLTEDLLKRYGSRLPADLPPKDLPKILSAVGALLRKDNPAEPHKVLASKPFPIYLTVNPDNSMEDALVEAGKSPRSDYSRWKSELENFEKFPRIQDSEPQYTPSEKNPLVYHLFGSLSNPLSLVLTEDDYFDYLLSVSSKAKGKDLTPSKVGKALTENALLFMGFRLDDWSFRVLLRSIFTKEGAAARLVSGLPCVGAQVQPEEGRILEAQGTRKYLERYFQKSNIDIYWGSVDEFVQEFVKQTA